MVSKELIDELVSIVKKKRKEESEVGRSGLQVKE